MSQNSGNKNKLRLLGISLVEELLLPKESAEGETLYRVKKQGGKLEAYYIVVFTMNKEFPPFIKLSDNVFCYPTHSANKFSFLKDAFRIGGKICAEKRVDLIHTQDCFATGLVGYLLKRKYNLPLCFSFAGDMIDNPYWLRERILNRFFNIMGKWLIKRANAFRVVSNSEREKLINMGIPEENIWNLGWITDFTKFLNADSNSMRSKYLGSNGKSKLLLFAGRLVEQKDLPTLLKAMPIILRSHSDALLLLIGQGYLQSKLQRLSIELGIERDVIFEGSLPYDEIPAYFASCDVFVLSSTYEGNARVLAEAAATAKPVVATDVSGTRDTVIDSVTGFIVEPKNPAQLAQRVILLLDNPTMAKQMGLKGREHVLHLYSDENILSGHMDMWEKTVAGYNSQNKISF